MSSVSSLQWFAAHELRLAWRDWSWLFGKTHRWRNAGIAALLFGLTIGLHGLAYHILNAHLADGFVVSKAALLVLTGGALLALTMMLSQALEMVTRAFYTRDDLDLILSSPSPAGHLFAVRLLMLAVSNAVMSGLFIAPFINVAIALDGWHWVGGYVVVVSLGMMSTAIATAIVLCLFSVIGARRTRLVAQVTAAIVSASFLIGIQAVAIVWFGNVSRFSVLSSDWLRSVTPEAGSTAWLIGHAINGELSAVTLFLAIAVGSLSFAAYFGSQRFCGHVLSAANIGETKQAASAGMRPVQVRSVRVSLMLKEWRLLARDPWLVSQTLMQLFYLVPPGLMLWVSFGENNPMAAIIGPVVVMAVSQLAGGLAWLAISGEDAPDLMATAPVSKSARVAAKLCAAWSIVGLVAVPFLIAMVWLSVWGAAATAFGTLLGTSSAIVIQMMFHVQAKRSLFRRRQAASKAATLCEAFAAILCAAIAGVLATDYYALAVIPGTFLAMVMVTAWLLRPEGVAQDGCFIQKRLMLSMLKISTRRECAVVMGTLEAVLDGTANAQVVRFFVLFSNVGRRLVRAIKKLQTKVHFWQNAYGSETRDREFGSILSFTL